MIVAGSGARRLSRRRAERESVYLSASVVEAWMAEKERVRRSVGREGKISLARYWGVLAWRLVYECRAGAAGMYTSVKSLSSSASPPA